MINGGYGDELDVSEVLAFERPWLIRTSLGITRVGDPDAEDVEQEGRIAIWRAVERYDASKGPLDMWVRANARWRMRAVRANGSWTGKTDGSRATLGGYKARVESVVPVGYLADMLSDRERTDIFLRAADLIDSAAMAYHHGQIAQAMSELPPRQREYVYLRFWEDASSGQLKTYFGYDAAGGMWNNDHGAKRRLRASLRHLASA